MGSIYCMLWLVSLVLLLVIQLTKGCLDLIVLDTLVVSGGFMQIVC